MWTDWTLLVAAALAAGVLNAVAGGGSFLTFPALAFTGVAAIPANATSAVAVSPGYLGSTLGFRAELSRLPRPRLWIESGLCAAGGLVGALLLLVTPAKLFAAVVPWLLVFATAVFALGPRLVVRRSTGTTANTRFATPGRHAGLLLVAMYGGYFNGGLGILLMALYSFTGESDIHVANALKNFNALVLSLLSVAAFTAAGAVAWPQALVMAAAATVGGFAGARIARRMPAAAVRAVVVVTGVVMSTVFFARQ